MKHTEMNGFSDSFSKEINASASENFTCASIKQEVTEQPLASGEDSKEDTVNSNAATSIPEKRRRLFSEEESRHDPTTDISQSHPDTTEILNTEMISRQILMDHKPQIKMTIFGELFSCSDCEEVFYTQLGLETHHKRITLNVVLNCLHCDLKKIFPNRCRLLNHLKSHGVIPSVDAMKGRICFEPLENSTVVHDYQIRLPHQFASPKAPPTASTTQRAASQCQENTKSESHSPSKSVTNGFANSTVRVIPNQLPKVKAYPSVMVDQQCPLTSLSTNHNNWEYFCSACQSDYMDLPNFVAHIQSAEASFSSLDLFQCLIDNVPSRSLCGLTLHTTLFHKQLPPYVCPDCGESFEEWNDMNEHARNICFHLSKAIMYKCNNKIKKNSVTEEVKERPLDCTRLFQNTLTLFQHLENHHTRDVLQCSRCPNAFTTRDLLLKHIYSEHGISCDDQSSATELLIEQMTKQLTQCLLCEVVFCTTLAYHNHLLPKLTEHCQRIIAFRCETCSQAFEHREDCRSHKCTQANKQMSVMVEAEPAFPMTIRTLDAKKPIAILPKLATLNNQCKAYNRYKCSHCTRFVSSKNLDKHEHFCRQNPRLALFCQVCSKSFRGSFGFLNHGKDHLNAGLKICLFCNNQTLSENEQLGEHIRLNHVNKIEAYPSTCTLCDASLLDGPGAEVHFKGHHYIGAENRFKCAICGLQFSQVKDLTTHKAVAHADKIVNILFTSTTVFKTEPRDAKLWNYRCKFCKFKEFMTLPGLRKHVRLHHTDVDYQNVRWKDMKRVKQSNGAPMPNPRFKKLLNIHRKKVLKPEPDLITSFKAEIPVSNAKHAKVNDTVPAIESSARELDGTFKCLKCPDSTFVSEDSFHDHVRTAHIWNEDDAEEEEEAISMNVGDNYWCPECSMEFVAKPSFEKHILFAHSYIENISQYLDNIGYGKREKPVLENQCEVCRLKCSCSLEYESHIRSHGMAFLRLRQQRRST